MNKFIRQINIVKNNDLETLENLLHDDFMFIRESGLVTRDEFVEHIKMLRTESGGLKFLDFKCCFEDENTLPQSFHNQSRKPYPQTSDRKVHEPMRQTEG